MHIIQSFLIIFSYFAISYSAKTESRGPPMKVAKGNKANPTGAIQKSKISPIYAAIKEQLQCVSPQSSI